MSRRAKIIAGAVLAVVLAIVAAVLWWTLRGEEPAAVDLGAAVAQLEGSTSAVPEAESVEAEPETGGERADPVAGAAEDAVTAAEAGSGDSGGASDLAVAEDAPAVGAESEVETAVVDVGPDDAGEGAAPVVEDAGAAEGEGSEVPGGAVDVTAAEDARSADPGTEPETATVDAGTSGLTGLWKLVTAEGADALTAEGAVSFAGFRVQEVLAGGIGENTAVGRTAAVSGYIELTDTALVTTKVIVEMGTLRTDDSHRDYHMREVLDTEEFPMAAFTLTEPIELPAGSAEGEPFSGSARGDLTIKGVTNSAVFDLQAQLVGDVIVVVGSSEVVFSDYGVPTPTSAAVLSVEDDGVMEFQLYFAR